MQQLIERDTELAAIAELVGRAGRGGSGVLLVVGEAGVGKTRLLKAVADRAAAEPVLVLRARGGELERSFPFGIAAQLFGAAVRGLDDRQRASLFSGAAALAGEIVASEASADAPLPMAEEALHSRLHGLYWLSAGLAAQRPLVCVLDDAHWADEPSLQWLLFMARRVADMPLTLVLSMRPRDAGNWPAPLMLLNDEATVSRLTPRPLTEPASRKLIGRLIEQQPDESFAAACHQATGGNPFLLVELMAAVRADGLAATAASAPQIQSLAPEGIIRSVLVRLGRVSPAAAEVARAVAVFGAEAQLRHAAALAGLDPDRAAHAADALVAAGLLDAGRPLRLTHPVVRTALYADLPEGERRRLHRQAAQVLANENADLDAIAAQLLASEPTGDPWTVDLLGKAAERALGRGAPATAVEYLRRALAEPPAPAERAAVLGRLSVIEGRLGDPAAAERARAAMELTPEGEQRSQLVLDLSLAYLVAGRFGDGIGALERAIEHVPERERERRLQLEAQLISFAGIDPAHAEVRTRHLERAPLGLRGETVGERAMLAELALAALHAGRPFEVAGDLARRAYGDGRLADEQPPGSLLLQNAIGTLVLTEQLELASSALDVLIERARHGGWPIVFALLSAGRSQLARTRGAIPDAIADAEAGVAASRRFGPSMVGPTLVGVLVGALLEAGDIAEAERALKSVAIGEQIPPIRPLLTLIIGRGRLRLAQGDTEAGIGDLLAGSDLLSALGIVNPAGTHCRSTAAAALATLGRRDEARQLVAEELSAARAFGARATVGITLRAAGVVEGGTAGIDYLREAVDQLELSPARLEHARALADLGAALRRAGQRRDAQQLLRQALDLADRCGAKPVAEQARAELVITGARPRRTRLNGVEALTASERRVAQLAAEGLTNRQIAQALFVSHPTVVTHLRHCYQKLDIGSREQLAATLGMPPQPDDR